MLLRPVCSQDATPQPATFCCSALLCLRTVREWAPEDEAISATCLQHIYQGGIYPAHML